MNAVISYGEKVRDVHKTINVFLISLDLNIEEDTGRLTWPRITSPSSPRIRTFKP